MTDDRIEVPGPITGVDRPADAARRWYDRLSRWYDRFVDPFEAPARQMGLDQLDVSSGERVLDAGCGTGSALVELARSTGPHGSTIGIDISPRMCRRATRSIDAANLEAGVVEGDLRETPFPDGAFDAVFASFVIELFDTPDIPIVLSEVSRILVPGGRLCVVSLSRRRAPRRVRLYERIHEWAPTYVDCRPIYVTETLESASFDVERPVDGWLFGLPVEVVIARVSPRV